MENNSLAAEDGSLAAQKADSLAAREADSLAAEEADSLAAEKADSLAAEEAEGLAAHRLALKRESLVQLEYSLAAGLCLIHLIQIG